MRLVSLRSLIFHRTPVENLQLMSEINLSMNVDAVRQVLHHIIRKVKHWSIKKALAHQCLNGSCILCNIVSDVLTSAEVGDSK